jgi:hypothetical protein
MRDSDIKIVRLAIVSLCGAVILEIIVIFATFGASPRAAFTVREIPTHLAAIVVGGLAGWFFELFREMTGTTAEILHVAKGMQTEFEALTAKIRYQDEALTMLTRCPRHNEALTSLVKASISDNFRLIPQVGAPDYLDFLQRAIVHSDGYEGIQRNSLSWFRETDGGAYLNALKVRKMRHKTRLFIIDETILDQWNRDRKDEECLRYYWSNTGDVKTYWITVSDFKKNFPAWPSPPEDLALYDRQLLIAYDQPGKLLRFDILDEASPEIRLFETIERDPDRVAHLHLLETVTVIP